MKENIKKYLNNRKNQTKIRAYLRATIQLVFFLLMPSAFTTAFSGIKYIFGQIYEGQRVELTSFINVLIILFSYTIIFGRFFCGYACAFGTMGDLVRKIYVSLCKKIKKKPFSIKKEISDILIYIKYIILFSIVLLCVRGKYVVMQGKSPWDVFSLIMARNYNFSKYYIGIFVLVFLIICMAVEERFFCKFICPMGAGFSLLPILPIFSLHRNRANCINGCSACTVKCPVNIELGDVNDFDVNGECIQCQKCIDICPKNNVSTKINILKGNEILFTLIRAALLFCLLKYAGI